MRRVIITIEYRKESFFLGGGGIFSFNEAKEFCLFTRNEFVKMILSFFWGGGGGRRGIIKQSNAHLQNLYNICRIIKVIKRSKANLIDLYIYVYFARMMDFN